MAKWSMIGFVAAAAVAAIAHSAAAVELATYYHAGAWDAFSGKTDDGRLVCGVGNTNRADGRRFTMRFTIGGQDVVFSASKPGWTIPDKTQAPVVMQIGLNTPWTEQASGTGQSLDWTMDRTTIQTFDSQFRRASSMTLTFPNGNEPPWTVPLKGSTAISNAFGRCITDLTARSQAAGGTPAPAPAPSGPTQPFAPPATGTGEDAQSTAPGGSQPTQPR